MTGTGCRCGTRKSRIPDTITQIHTKCLRLRGADTLVRVHVVVLSFDCHIVRTRTQTGSLSYYLATGRWARSCDIANEAYIVYESQVKPGHIKKLRMSVMFVANSNILV